MRFARGGVRRDRRAREIEREGFARRVGDDVADFGTSVAGEERIDEFGESDRV